MKKIVMMMLSMVMVLGCFIAPASAATSKVKLADPTALISTCAEKTGIAADLDAMVNAGILTSGEKKMVTNNGVITRVVAWRVLLPVFGIYPYPASCYPEIPAADQCVDDYANARCAAITLGLATKEENPIQAMTANELSALISALKKGVSLPKIETGIPYVDSVEAWSMDTYQGRNSMIDAYVKIPTAWFTDFEEQNWQFKFELPTQYDASQVLVNHIVAGQTRYADKVILIGHARARVTIHEMVHYMVRRIGITNDQINSIYATESVAMKEQLGAYSQTKGTEFIPEFVAYWIENPAQHDALKAAAPLSAELAEQLVAWNQAA